MDIGRITPEHLLDFMNYLGLMDYKARFYFAVESLM